MDQKKIIAVRYKKHAWIFVVLSLLWLILYFSVEVPKYAQGEANGFLFWLITVLMLCFLFMSVCILLVPKTAVTKEGETLVLHEIFRKKVIPSTRLNTFPSTKSARIGRGIGNWTILSL